MNCEKIETYIIEKKKKCLFLVKDNSEGGVCSSRGVFVCRVCQVKQTPKQNKGYVEDFQKR
jgi:hypothetical protein